MHSEKIEELVDRLADLTIRGGANVQPGRPVLVMADIAHAPIVRAVVERAYAAGAGLVQVDWSDSHVRRSAVAHATVEALSAPRSWVLDRYEEMDREGGAFIVLTGDPEPGLMAGLDPAKAAAVPAEEESARRRIYMGGKVT